MLPARLSGAVLVAALASSTLVDDAGAQACSPPLRPRIAEILYDAVGDDTGHEFVELFNPDSVARALSGVRLEAGDGSGPGRWTLRWTGGASDTLAPGGRFVIGGASIGVAAQAVVDLDLQNGPDALRLVWPDGAVEVVGWGALEFPEYSCGAPAVDVASGQSLARVPDDANAGSNAADFRAAAPTPGAPNQRRRDVGWVAGVTRATPDLAMPGQSVTVSGTLENRGSESLAPGACEWSVSETGASAPLARGALAGALAAGESTAVSVTVPALLPGKRRLVLRAALEGDEAPSNDTDSVWVRIGQGPLQLTEIQFHPSGGEGEWVELRNTGAVPLDLTLWGFADRGGHPGRVAAGVLAPESLAVLAQDRTALLTRFPRLDTTRVLRLSPWPSLNNSDDPSGVADVANLIDEDGTPSDRVAYSAAGIPAGVPLERDVDGRWAASLVAEGTPLEPPRARAPVSGRFEVEPRRVRGTGGEARLAWDLPWPRARLACDLYDLAGRPRGSVLPEIDAGRRGERRWTPQGVPPGIYLVVLRARETRGEGRLAVTRPIRVEP